MLLLDIDGEYLSILAEKLASMAIVQKRNVWYWAITEQKTGSKPEKLSPFAYCINDQKKSVWTNPHRQDVIVHRCHGHGTVHVGWHNFIFFFNVAVKVLQSSWKTSGVCQISKKASKCDIRQRSGIVQWALTPEVPGQIIYCPACCATAGQN